VVVVVALVVTGFALLLVVGFVVVVLGLALEVVVVVEMALTLIVVVVDDMALTLLVVVVVVLELALTLVVAGLAMLLTGALVAVPAGHENTEGPMIVLVCILPTCPGPFLEWELPGMI
jgi:hypothetical protein